MGVWVETWGGFQVSRIEDQVAKFEFQGIVNLLLHGTVLNKEALTFEFVDGILKCTHSNESFWAVALNL